MLIALPQRHDGWLTLCRPSLKQRHAMTATEEDCEQTDYPTHGSLSVKLGCSYTVRDRDHGKTGTEIVNKIIKSWLGFTRQVTVCISDTRADNNNWGSVNSERVCFLG
jgi:hypothetical protein